MRLSELITAHKESILQDFEEFARTHTKPGASMDVTALRDHAEGVLEAFVHDLEEPQTEGERERKAKGDAPGPEGWEDTAAQAHGLERARSGFSMVEAVAEYRALRASVLRRWMAEGNGRSQPEVQDVIRFNEALDQAIAESIERYSKAISEYRSMFLAMLGHDLRSPLDAVMNASTFLADNADLSARDEQLARTIQRSGTRMLDLISDMLDFTSSQLGRGIPLRPEASDLGRLVAEAVHEARMTHTRREFRLAVGEEMTGKWDVRRVRQAISNLLDNAAQHGATDSVITVRVSEDVAADDLVVAVHNDGPAIPDGEREQIFDPFQRGSAKHEEGDGPRRSVGLGLYIARQVAEAHGGGLGVESAEDEGTTFFLRLPRETPYSAMRT